MSSRSPAEAAYPARTDATASVGVIACGALAGHITEITRRRGWTVAVHPLPPLLHNRPERIAAAVDRLAAELAPRHRRLAVAYAECGTGGTLDAVCARRGLVRLAGRHCYDTFAGTGRIDALMEEEPGTYLLTDFLVRTFDRVVVRELGLDRWPELRDVYFAHYRRVVWLATDLALADSAAAAAAALGLPLEIVPVGDDRLERELAALLTVEPRTPHATDLEVDR
jgi:Protein of unknown function (DUF1638)